MVAQESLKNSRAMLLNGADTGGIPYAYQENSAIHQKKLFFNAELSNPFKKIGEYRPTPISGIFKILTDLSTTLFHVELACA